MEELATNWEQVIIVLNAIATLVFGWKLRGK